MHYDRATSFIVRKQYHISLQHELRLIVPETRLDETQRSSTNLVNQWQALAQERKQKAMSIIVIIIIIIIIIHISSYGDVESQIIIRQAPFLRVHFRHETHVINKSIANKSEQACKLIQYDKNNSHLMCECSLLKKALDIISLSDEVVSPLQDLSWVSQLISKDVTEVNK